MRCLNFLQIGSNSPHQSPSVTASPRGEANCAHSPWGQCATNIGAKFHCGRTVTDCGGFVRITVTERPQKPYRHNPKANCPYGSSEQCSPLHCCRKYSLSLHLWAARQIRFPPQPRHRDTAITVSAAASNRHKKRPSQSDSGDFFCCYFASARERKVTTWAREHCTPGAKVPSPLP